MSHPKVYEWAKNEVRAVFKSPDQITLAAVSSTESLPYLNAAIRETFRCYSSVPSTLPRITGAGGSTIVGQHIPADVSGPRRVLLRPPQLTLAPQTTVGVNHWSTYRSANNFEAPDEFIPERWLADAPPRFGKDQHEALQPFHIGPRSCLGKK